MRRISYNKLWKKLIDVKWTKQKLSEEAKISSASVTKLSKDTNITQMYCCASAMLLTAIFAISWRL